jgi:hypothetical protein
MPNIAKLISIIAKTVSDIAIGIKAVGRFNRSLIECIRLFLINSDLKSVHAAGMRKDDAAVARFKYS